MTMVEPKLKRTIIRNTENSLQYKYDYSFIWVCDAFYFHIWTRIALEMWSIPFRLDLKNKK